MNHTLNITKSDAFIAKTLFFSKNSNKVIRKWIFLKIQHLFLDTIKQEDIFTCEFQHENVFEFRMNQPHWL